MGWWGLESCSNDGCWDLLCDIADIHNPRHEESMTCLKNVFGQKNVSPYSNDIRVGVVIWLLNHGITVPVEYIKQAVEWQKELLLDNGYIADEWGHDEHRAQIMREELKQMEEAIENDGKGEVKHVPGLLERMSEG